MLKSRLEMLSRWLDWALCFWGVYVAGLALAVGFLLGRGIVERHELFAVAIGFGGIVGGVIRMARMTCVCEDDDNA